MKVLSSTIELWARPGSPEDALSWDPWRHRWVVACRAPAVHSAANRAILRLLAGWLGVAGSQLRLERGERTRSKRVAVQGLSDTEVRERLGRALGPAIRTA